MKKLIALISLMLLFAVGLQAQKAVTAASGTVTTLGNQYSNIVVTTTASDTVGGTATKEWIFAVDRPKLSFYTFLTKIDTVLKANRVQGNRVWVRLYGSMDNSTYIQVGSTIKFNVTAGTNGDSTLAISDVSTGVLWKYLKLSYTGELANKAAKPVTIQIKVADK